jgi:hypothetical protein
VKFARCTGVPELRKSSITCLLLKLSTFSFFLDDSCVSTAHSPVFGKISGVNTQGLDF